MKENLIVLAILASGAAGVGLSLYYEDFTWLWLAAPMLLFAGG